MHKVWEKISAWWHSALYFKINLFQLIVLQAQIFLIASIHKILLDYMDLFVKFFWKKQNKNKHKTKTNEQTKKYLTDTNQQTYLPSAGTANALGNEFNFTFSNLPSAKVYTLWVTNTFSYISVRWKKIYIFFFQKSQIFSSIFPKKDFEFKQILNNWRSKLLTLYPWKWNSRSLWLDLSH